MTVQEFQTAFVAAQSQDADSVHFTPGRVNLIGEHTDYNGGSFFPCALSFGIYLLIRKNGGNTVRFRSLNQHEIIELGFDQLTTPLDKV